MVTHSHNTIAIRVRNDPLADIYIGILLTET
jgi:hypothetical protein